MQRSDERILTSHVGSLLRSRKLAKLLIEKEQNLDYDAAAFRQAVDDNRGPFSKKDFLSVLSIPGVDSGQCQWNTN